MRRKCVIGCALVVVVAMFFAGCEDPAGDNGDGGGGGGDGDDGTFDIAITAGTGDVPGSITFGDGTEVDFSITVKNKQDDLNIVRAKGVEDLLIYSVVLPAAESGLNLQELLLELFSTLDYVAEGEITSLASGASDVIDFSNTDISLAGQAGDNYYYAIVL